MPRRCRLAKGSDDADQTRRLLALAAVYDGGSRSEAVALALHPLQLGRVASPFGLVIAARKDGLRRKLRFLASVRLRTMPDLRRGCVIALPENTIEVGEIAEAYVEGDGTNAAISKACID